MTAYASAHTFRLHRSETSRRARVLVRIVRISGRQSVSGTERGAHGSRVTARVFRYERCTRILREQEDQKKKKNPRPIQVKSSRERTRRTRPTRRIGKLY